MCSLAPVTVRRRRIFWNCSMVGKEKEVGRRWRRRKRMKKDEPKPSRVRLCAESESGSFCPNRKRQSPKEMPLGLGLFAVVGFPAKDPIRSILSLRRRVASSSSRSILPWVFVYSPRSSWCSCLPRSSRFSFRCCSFGCACFSSRLLVVVLCFRAGVSSTKRFCGG